MSLTHTVKTKGFRDIFFMKFVEQDENIYMPIFGEVAVLSQLPAKIYTIKSNSMQGLYLEVYSDKFEINEQKLYGEAPKKVNKIIRTYDLANRNTGVIMSGDKGLGKTLCSKVLCNKMIEKNYPVILCDKPFSGIADFLHKIEQECVVLFDEFEKHFTFKHDNGDEDDKPQEQFLTLFDGVDTGKKLFIVTCNDTYKLNDFFLNRPGRFHYHIEFDFPTSEEIREYMMDNCIDDNNIEAIITFARFRPLNYDSLRAIAFELHNGYDFKDAIADLNILMISSTEYRIKAVDESGNSDWDGIDIVKLMTPNRMLFCRFSIQDATFSIEFNTNDLIYNNGTYYVDLKKSNMHNTNCLKSPIKEIKIYNNNNTNTLHFTRML